MHVGQQARTRGATVRRRHRPVIRRCQAIVRRDACRAPRILMHRNEAVARPPAVPN